MTNILTARIAALLSAFSVMVHALALTQSGGNDAATWIMGAMAVACLVCTWRLWKGASIRCWAETFGMYGAMLVVHYLVPMHPTAHVGSHHHHGAAAAPMINFHEVSLVVMWMMAVMAAACLVVAVSRRLLAPAIPHPISTPSLLHEDA